ncbi:MAG: nucleotidyltransferase family protein [Pseudomonadota bacterium]
MRHASTSLMIFAAGFGTRMGALTAEKPKPLITVGGKPLIDHALDVAEGAGCAPIAVNTHFRAAQMAAHLAGRSGVTVSHEAPDILDTGGGLKHALPHLPGDAIATLNSDAVWRGPNAVQALLANWDPARMDALLLCVPPERAHGRKGGGDFSISADGRLSRGGAAVYVGAQILRPDRVAAYPEQAFSLNAIWDLIAADGRLFGLVYPGHWCDVGHPEGLAEAEALLSGV